MANTPKALWRGNTTTSLVQVYQAPNPGTTIVTNIVVANSGTTPATVLIYVSGVILVPTMSVPGNGIFTLDIAQPMDAAGTIKVQGSSTTCAVHIAGVEVSA
ncbi:hypothetical protein SEA_DEXERS_20 [Streptomyces phage Dexers]|uniref:Uncharacterized protein n=1 Tax=Streptomyces phage Alsaber TaxID=2053672 RepID=A0A2H4PGG3_9CAUD|nr:hypothetical protein KGG97_gp22 [Streptomyces phage Alsaber]ATW61297.1 hypothetical protein SEA_ALSABER_22 [Streptomyces phage Alsaber]WMI34541.1 hypothetical protein SEA_DEXERS_20 [Streptomyces phage Dexers]